MAETIRMRHQHGRESLPPMPTGYYGLPALKPSHWKWMVAFYIWLAGIAGAAQVLATLVLMVAPDVESAMAVTRPARYGAFFAAAIGAVLLIADLMTPKRFLNMLRIFRRTSPMSFGSYLLVGFSVFTAITVLAQLVSDLGLVSQVPRWLEITLQLPAAAFGVMMIAYTAPLLSATSTPLWAHAPALLAGSFAGYSMAAGASALVLWNVAWGGSEYDQALERVALLSLAAAWVFMLAWLASMASARLTAPLVQGATGWLFVLGVLGAGLVLPVAIHLWQLFTLEQIAWATLVAACAELLGSLLWRGALLLGGQTSAQRPADALRFASGNPKAHRHDERIPPAQPVQGSTPYWLIGALAVGGIAAVVLGGLALLA